MITKYYMEIVDPLEPNLSPPLLPMFLHVSRNTFPIYLLLPPNRLRPSFFEMFFKRLDENPRNFRSEHLRTCPNFHYLDILLSHKYFRYFPLTRNVKVNLSQDGG